MSEWWTYRLSNFLLFSPRTYDRLFELYNAAIWPAQAAAFLVGLVILFFLFRPTAARGRAAFGMLAACWIWVAVAFHAKRYATINFAAVQFAWAFGAEAALLLWYVVSKHGLRPISPPCHPEGSEATLCHPEESEATEGSTPSRRVIRVSSPSQPGHHRAGGASPSPTARWGSAGTWIFAYALFLHPFGAFLSGREWRGMEVFGVTPDPTAIATIGAVLAVARRRRWPLLVVPILWCAVSGATLLAMKDPRCWILFLAAAIPLLGRPWLQFPHVAPEDR
jgi:hypothetical protein